MKILVEYSESEISQRAFAVAQKRAKMLKAKLHVFAAATGNGAAKVRKASLKDAEMMCTACGIECKIQMSDQDVSVADDLIAYAEENQIDEIVIGLRSRSNLGKLIFGSTSRRIILEAPCPVLIVK